MGLTLLENTLCATYSSPPRCCSCCLPVLPWPALYSTFKDDKRIIPARDELSAFVASGGAIRGAYVESALEQARKDHPGLQANDEELARAILSQDDPVADH